MTTYKMLKLLIEKGRYEYEDMYAKLDTFMAFSRITIDEYTELVEKLPTDVEDSMIVEDSEPVTEDDNIEDFEFGDNEENQ